jgi:exodeoxyribonuclease V alpha subunit
MTHDILNRLLRNGLLTELDIHFADFISGLSETTSWTVSLAAALVSNATRQGHICLDLTMIEGRQLLNVDSGNTPVFCPKLDAWIREIRKSRVVGRPGERAPLIVDDRSRLYLYRYWDYQQRLADLIERRVQTNRGVNMTVLKAGLDRLFPEESPKQQQDRVEDDDWQKIAASVALIRQFCIISGGPGTGKTTTVAKILALMLEQPDSSPLRIALAAPTGKAAARLKEAIKDSKGTLDCAEDIEAKIPAEATTIHRLLGGISGSPYFRHDERNPLPIEVLVVDEASMVDLALMSKLIQALPTTARLILLGDKDQLASVEAGAVLGDMCDTDSIDGFSKPFCDIVSEASGYEVETIPDKGARSGIWDCVVELKKNFRFGKTSGIGALSRSVNAGDDDSAFSLLTRNTYRDFHWNDMQDFRFFNANMKSRILKRFESYLKVRSVEEGFALFDRFRVLCALREGPYGVANLNRLIGEILGGEGLIEPHAKWYHGRPVLINSNDYNLKLFNGDVGIVWHDRESDGLRVFFSDPDGSLRKFHPVRLPEHETAFAMTVHKSQGSEFNEVLLVLPDKDYPVLTRELLYTGITRARDFIEMWGTEEILRKAISRRIERMSGLHDALWKAARVGES